MINLTPFDSLLIANRGEIACRIIRTAKTMGLKTIAVYSDADANAPHVKMADQAVHIGGSAAHESYLVIKNILAAAKHAGAHAIHPGYGFLSENSDFAKACTEAGFVFIGPNTAAIDVMGDKAKAKRRMIAAGVPCVPGYQGEIQDDATLIAQSEIIGFPIMVKAAAGGGGRGMRLVNDAQALPDAIKDARSEALNAFGSDILILERAVQKPRHIEIQVFADNYGNIIHLGERDCSVQRRHQKVLEEAPCPVMTDALRGAMGASAVKAAKDIGYVGAGTVEFLLDSTGEYYFLEMNTRLQVEHPVTEMITGLDLVAMQIRIARGETLGLSQDDITLSGHAIEARLYAEDPSADFLPATGPIHHFAPASGLGIRVDSGIETGGEVSPFYDPMVAKIIAYGPSREDARRKLLQALRDTAIFGVKTNKPFLIDALSDPIFAAGNATTAFIDENFDESRLNASPITPQTNAIAALLQHHLSQQAALALSLPIAAPLLNWSSATKIGTPYAYANGENMSLVTVTPMRGDLYDITIGDVKLSAKLIKRDANYAQFELNGTRYGVHYHAASQSTLHLDFEGQSFTFTNQNAILASAIELAGAGGVVAPMHGALLEIFVTEGKSVSKGTRLAILEAMKMQHEILAEIDGTVTAIHVKAGTQIAADTIIMDISEDA